jgi:hypothetical protein
LSLRCAFEHDRAIRTRRADSPSWPGQLRPTQRPDIREQSISLASKDSSLQTGRSPYMRRAHHLVGQPPPKLFYAPKPRAHGAPYRAYKATLRTTQRPNTVDATLRTTCVEHTTEQFALPAWVKSLSTILICSQQVGCYGRHQSSNNHHGKLSNQQRIINSRRHSFQQKSWRDFRPVVTCRWK